MQVRGIPPLRRKEIARMGHGGFKLQVQQRIIKTSHEMPGDKPWKRWRTKNVSHFPTARLRLSLWIYSRNLLHLEFECAHGAFCINPETGLFGFVQSQVLKARPWAPGQHSVQSSRASKSSDWRRDSGIFAAGRVAGHLASTGIHKDKSQRGREMLYSWL